MVTKRKPRKDAHDPVRIVMTCPRCPDELHEDAYGPIAIERCIRCDGAWLHEGELRRILLSPPRDPGPFPALRPADAVRRPVRCPKCGKTMDRYEYGDSEIHLDRCTGHGTWFDRGELERVEAYARSKDKRAAKGGGGFLGFLRGLLKKEKR